MPKKNLLILKRQITRTIHYVNIFKFGILEVIGKGTKGTLFEVIIERFFFSLQLYSVHAVASLVIDLLHGHPAAPLWTDCQHKDSHKVI